MIKNAHALSGKDVLAELKTSRDGLAHHEAEKRQTKFGPNELKKKKRASALKIFLEQFKNAFLLLLFFAGILTIVLGEYIEAAAIFGIILLNAILGFIQEYKAEQSMEALEKLSSHEARVVREGKEHKIESKNLTYGDIIIVEAGDIIPADARIIEQAALQIDESSITGESVPVKKHTNSVKEDASEAEQIGMVFAGTTVTYGKAVCVVTNIGMHTALGKIAESIQDVVPQETPLQKKFTALAKQISIIALVLVVAVLALGTFHGTPFAEMLIFALALTVSTVPSALPVIVTVSLSMGTKRLAKKNMLIKKLPAAESLGATTIICSDKTGTITKNQMTVTTIYTNSTTINVTGTGYAPEGKFMQGENQIAPQNLDLLLRIGYLCNNAKLNHKDGKYTIIGDPTEGALTVLGRKGEIDEKKIREEFIFIQELPFDSDRKSMSCVFLNKATNKKESYVKGAPDILLHSCNRILENGAVRPMSEEDRRKIIEINDGFAKKALRILALAYREVQDLPTYTIDYTEKDLIYVGLVGMIDPARPEVHTAIAKCHHAGIKVMIITGDNANTTKAVAEQIGLFKEGDLVLTGGDIDKMSDKQLDATLEQVCIIARALPIQKLRIVESLQRQGHIVAMTGDGVNDAPALKKADIGIAMGITGTDIAKEVASAVLLDDNFASIVNAIEEGRNIYDKMIKTAKYLLSCNSGEIFSVFIAIMLGFPLPILPLQLLLMNLLTDEFPALGLGLESSEEGIMKRPPRDPKAKPLTTNLLISILLFGLIMAAGTLFVYMQYKDISLPHAQTAAFTTLVLFQMFAVISSRSLCPSWSKLNPFSNLWLLLAIIASVVIQLAVIYLHPLQVVFGTVALPAKDWGLIIGVSALGFVLMEISKFLFSKEGLKKVKHG